MVDVGSHPASAGGLGEARRKQMNVHLVTTTIGIPHVLRLFRKFYQDVKFWVVGDLKTPHTEVTAFLADIENAVYLPPEHQKHWRCSEPIGWSCVQRRNIGFLEALKDGAETIITLDDDNLPMNDWYFRDFAQALTDPRPEMEDTWSGLQIGGPHAWVDIGKLMYPRDGIDPVVQRGTPQPRITNEDISFVTDAKIGLATGVILGDPDTSAVDRISRSYPQVHQVSELLHQGVVLHPQSYAAVNSQNTAFLKQFAPSMFMAPGIGRGDDIVAGLLTQRIMRDAGYQVHFGQPFVYQERHHHDLIADLKAEMWLNENVLEITDFLDRMSTAPDAITSCRYFWGGCNLFPQRTVEAALAFLEDVGSLAK